MRRVGVAIVCAKITLVPLVFDTASDIPFAVPKGILSHALAYVLTGVIIGLVLLYGRSVFVRSWLHVPVAVFLVVNVAATVFAADQLLALYGAHGRMVGLATIADGVLLYFAIVLLVRTRSDAIAVLGSGLAAASLVLAYAFVQFVGRDPFAWNVSSATRPFSTLGQTTSLAEYLTVVSVGAAAFALFERSLRPVVRGLLLLVSAASVAGVLVTQTRSAILGLVAGAAMLVFMTWIAHPSRRARVLSLGGGFAVSAAVAVVLLFTPLGARVLSTVDISASADTADEGGPRLEQSADVRLAIYEIAFDMFRERPVLGFGPDNFAVGQPKYRSATEPDEIQQGVTTSAHSWVAQVLSATGALGLVSLITTVVVAIVLTIRAGFRPAAWAGVGMLAAFLGAGLTTVNAVSTEWLLWAAVGAVGAATAKSQVDPQAPTIRSRSGYGTMRGHGALRLGSAVVCVAAGMGLALTAGSALAGSHAARESQLARLATQPQQAIDAGRRATQLDGLRAYYWDTLGLAYISADRTLDGASAFERASKLAPYDVRYAGDLARAYVQLVQRGDSKYVGRARDVGESAVRTDPNNPQANLTRALVMAVTGDLSEAVHSVERALALDPHSTNLDLYLVAAQIYRASGRQTDAIAVARRATTAFSAAATMPIRIELARALAASGQSAQALTELDVVLAINPSDAVALQLRNQIRAGSTQQ